MQKKILQTIIFIIFWDFDVFLNFPFTTSEIIITYKHRI